MRKTNEKDNSNELKDFENESDFAISDNSRINDSSVLKSVQNRESNLKVPPSVNADDKD